MNSGARHAAQTGPNACRPPIPPLGCPFSFFLSATLFRASFSFFLPMIEFYFRSRLADAVAIVGRCASYCGANALLLAPIDIAACAACRSAGAGSHYAAARNVRLSTRLCAAGGHVHIARKAGEFICKTSGEAHSSPQPPTSQPPLRRWESPCAASTSPCASWRLSESHNLPLLPTRGWWDEVSKLVFVRTVLVRKKEMRPRCSH